ncbi:unnamed protein product [Lymnaea stagnalis]|uniref:Delta-like protein n=1 Tax=Lymnaea stagnalis TaxID=6523 RepID=A0AAV2HGM5_LYMST
MTLFVSLCILQSVILSSLLQVTEGNVYISIKFLTFRNPRGVGSNGHCCDGKWQMCFSPCDHSFFICLDQIDGPSKDTKHCTYKTFISGEITDQNYINFKNTVGELSNPLVWQLNSWPGAVKLKVEVYDVDGSSTDEHIDTLISDIYVAPSISMKRLILTGRTELTTDVQIYCGSNFYGQNCSVFCVPRDNSSGHYTCDQGLGHKICHKGWVGQNCEINEDNCVDISCQNGGVCRDQLNDYQCLCAEGFEGRFCEEDINECLNTSRCVKGECINLPGLFTCKCHAGFAGVTCDENIDDCSLDPCENGATCIDDIGSYYCHCTVGFTGPECSSDLNECDYVPCKNNGSCVNFVGSYMCECLPGYRGSDCASDMDECLRLPCKNQGSCRNYLGGYQCDCLSGFEGLHCESDINECDVSNSTCQHGAKCVNMDGNYTCECAAGFQGRWCDQDINECLRNPCQHRGHCDNKPGSFQCKCRKGYTGKFCEHNINECDLGACKNDGNCTDLEGSFACACNDLWEGPTCELNIDDCVSHPCQNSGICKDTNEGFLCICPRGFLDTNCEVDLDECQLDGYCFNNATCENTYGGFLCTCQDGWTSDRCNQDVDECMVTDCNNWGKCINTPGSFTCECPINWTGQRCDTDVNECDGMTDVCHNGATCVNLRGTFQCLCPAGWTGLLCDLDVNECQLSPDLCTRRGNLTYDNVTQSNVTSKVHTVCLNTQPGYVCDCAPGWTGVMCDVDIDECAQGRITIAASSQAIHGGSSRNDSENSSRPSLEQSTFEKIPDASSPDIVNTTWGVSQTESKVRHFGPDTGKFNTSTNNSNTSTSGMTGEGLRVNHLPDMTHALHTTNNPTNKKQPPLPSRACLFNSKCVNTIGSFICACPAHRTGKRCELDLHVACTPNISCNNHGSCRPTVLRHVALCVCDPGWAGQFCDRRINSDQTCQDTNLSNISCFNRTLVNASVDTSMNTSVDTSANAPVDTSFNTSVHESSTVNAKNSNSTDNEILISPNNSPPVCDLRYCFNNGLCYLNDTSSPGMSCACPRRWTGARCENESVSTSLNRSAAPCIFNVCQNNGSCTDHWDSLFCSCPVGFTGKICEENVSKCDNSSCSDHGHCILESETFHTCVCDQGWTGQNCEDDIMFDCMVEPCDNNGECSRGNGSHPCLCQGMWSGIKCSSIDITLPFYLACPISEANPSAVNQGLQNLFTETHFYDGKQLEISHKSEPGKSEAKKKEVTAIYPSVKVDGKLLSDDEVTYVINKVINKLIDYMCCPLFLDAVDRKLAPPEEPLNSNVADWYPALITACGLFLIVIVALIIVKCHRKRLEKYKIADAQTKLSYRNELFVETEPTTLQASDLLSTDQYREFGDAAVRTSHHHINNSLYASVEDVKVAKQESSTVIAIQFMTDLETVSIMPYQRM